MLMKNIVYQLFILLALSLSAQRLETVVQTGHTRPVKSIAISNNGKLFASSGRDKSIVLWDAQTHKQIKSFIGHEASILGLRFSPNDSLLASVSSDKTVKLWDINSSEIIYEYLDKDYLLNVAFHPKDNLIAIGGYPFSFKIIDYKAKTVIRDVPCDPEKGMGGGVDLEFSQSGDFLFTGEDNKVARIFETRNYEPLHKFDNLYGSCGGCATQVAYDEKNKKLYKLSKYDSLKVYSTTDYKLLLAIGNKVNEIGGIQISNDGTKVYACYNDTLFVYNATTGAEIKFFDLKKNGIEKVSSLVVNESDSTFYVASGDTYIKGISLLTGNIGKSFFGINNFKDKGGLDYNEDSYWDSYIGRCMYFKNYFMMLDHDKSFVTGKLGKDAIVWDLYSGEPVNYYGGNSKAVICFDKWTEKNQIVYGDADGAISIWDNLNNKLIKKIEVHREPVFSVCFNKAQNQIITTSWDASIGIFDATTFAKIKYIDLKNSSAFSLKPVKNGLYLAMGKLDKTFVLMEPDTKEIVLEFKGHTDVVSSIEENTKTGELLTASWDGTTRIWNISSGLMTLRVKTPGTIHSAIYHHDYSKFYTAGSDGIIRIWDAKTGKLITKLIGHKAEITQLHLSEDGQNLFSLSTDGTLKNWDLQKGKNFTSISESLLKTGW
jgi:WD40 repeat protein